jgi:hypothetical protein
MTQQEINNYFLSINYTEVEPNTFVDNTNEFTFVTSLIDIHFLHSNYAAVIKNLYLSTNLQLQNWIDRVINDSQTPII